MRADLRKLRTDLRKLVGALDLCPSNSQGEGYPTMDQCLETISIQLGVNSL